MQKTGPNVDTTESRLIRAMAKAGLTWSKIQEITGRSPDTINTHVNGNPFSGPGPGQPTKVPEKVVKKLERVLEQLLIKANAKRDVTIQKVKAVAAVKACDRSVLDALHAVDIYYRKLKERQVLKDEDLPVRLAWGKTRKRRSKREWVTKPHAIIDNKKFAAYLNKNARAYAARRSVRGAYQRKGGPVKRHLVKESKALKFPAPGLMVSAAVIKGKIRMWHYTEGRWTGAAAAHMYSGPLLSALKRAYPGHKGKFTVIEDNDPTGYKSGKAIKAKQSAGIVTDDLPKRSPDLNVLDYSLWKAVNMKMRETEKAFPHNKKESVQAFKGRLKRTATSLSQPQVERAVMDMHKRVRLLVDANGGLFKEGR